MTGSAPEARRYALRLLAYRGRSEQELLERLTRKGFDPATAAATVEDLKGRGFIDDAQLAVQLKRQAGEGKLLGHRAVKVFLSRRGISRDTVESVLHYDEETELGNIRRLLSKKAVDPVSVTASERKRLWNFFIRKGYSTDTIRKVLTDRDVDEEVL